MLAHLLAFISGSVAGADGGTDRIERDALGRGQFGDFGEGNFEVLMDVVAERLERRYIYDFGLVGKLAGARAPDQAVEADEKGGQCFTGSGGRGNQDVAAGANLGPAENLRLGCAGESCRKPLGDEGIEIRECWRKTSGVSMELGVHLHIF